MNKNLEEMVGSSVPEAVYEMEKIEGGRKLRDYAEKKLNKIIAFQKKTSYASHFISGYEFYSLNSSYMDNLNKHSFLLH